MRIFGEVMGSDGAVRLAPAGTAHGSNIPGGRSRTRKT